MKLALLLGLAMALYLWWQRRPGIKAEEAARILGIARDASADDIRAAHRRLIAKLHPDTGGSPELAARINAARDALLTTALK